MENAEINNIIKIVGLQYKKNYEDEDSLKTLCYGKIMIMTDQDQDGSHIKGLLINFILHNWPSLLQHHFLEEFITPIVKRVDPDVLKACENSCILYSDLGLPKELTLWAGPCEVCCRYGEKNNAFIVASFENEDENKDEISRKVTRAFDKVTSDYHSGSSSSDEEASKEMEVKTNLVTAAASPVYQISELIFPPLPMWHPLPRKKPGMYQGNGHQNHYPPPVPFGYPNQGRKNKPYHPIPVTWVPPAEMHCDWNHWINPHMLVPH
ncbi:Protein btg3 [Saguinus oedipus]|uniref:Protein btg3 n=1 Tax=Saguinus oedipus TaxID=9490 RepID=A0ABQ9VF55_SAGOE|nr:Protein btg3 [Saguinus oedipus]